MSNPIVEEFKNKISVDIDKRNYNKTAILALNEEDKKKIVKHFYNYQKTAIYLNDEIINELIDDKQKELIKNNNNTIELNKKKILEFQESNKVLLEQQKELDNFNEIYEKKVNEVNKLKNIKINLTSINENLKDDKEIFDSIKQLVSVGIKDINDSLTIYESKLDDLGLHCKFDSKIIEGIKDSIKFNKSINTNDVDNIINELYKINQAIISSKAILNESEEKLKQMIQK